MDIYEPSKESNAPAVGRSVSGQPPDYSPSLPIQIKELQQKFRARLFPRRLKMIEEARKRHAVQMAKWAEEEKERRQWANVCRSLTCRWCGEQKSRVCCQTAFLLNRLIPMLRRKAGLHRPRQGTMPTASMVTQDEWSDWNRGKAGNRKCGPGSWDNVVRAMEEDGE